jgi:acyl carrier protein
VFPDKLRLKNKYPMELNAITAKLKTIISSVIENEGIAASLGDDADIINDVGLDSLQMIEFMLEIEESFSVELNFDNINISHLNSIKTLGLYLQTQLSA